MINVSIPAAIFILTFALSLPARADRRILKNGGVVQSRIVEQTAKKVVIEDIDGVRSEYEIGNVEKVVKESRGLASVGTDEI